MDVDADLDPVTPLELPKVVREPATCGRVRSELLRSENDELLFVRVRIDGVDHDLPVTGICRWHHPGKRAVTTLIVRSPAGEALAPPAAAGVTP